METFVKGEVVVVPFPFSDLSQFKRRPAFILSNPFGNDIILCQITSKDIKDQYSISINDTDFITGSLKVPSNVRPNKIFTVDKNIILYKIGILKPEKIKEITEGVINLLNIL